MKLRVRTTDMCRCKPMPASARRGRENGFAVLVVFVLLTIMVVLVASNTAVLRHLHQEIKLVEKRQLKKFEAALVSPPVQTNVVTALPEKPSE